MAHGLLKKNIFVVILLIQIYTLMCIYEIKYTFLCVKNMLKYKNYNLLYHI